ncbi:MAG TPA: ABC transporter substrate-binding protein, partial [Amoebophilaceae bacterium]|nr:ABC transporter substrate-binding protein [Amoebophilaceae bacterium]
AISLAFDRETYAQLFTGGLGKVPHSFIPPSFEGHDKTFRNPYAAYDLEQAKKLLAEAGYPGGKDLPELSLACIANTEIKTKADFFVQCMAKIGIAVTVDQMPFPTLCNKIQKRQFVWALMGSQASFPNALDYFNIIRDATAHSIAIVDPPFNAWYDQAVGTQEKTQQIGLYQGMDKRVAELVPAIRLPMMPSYVLAHDRVQNYCISPYHFGMEQFLDVKEPAL